MKLAGSAAPDTMVGRFLNDHADSVGNSVSMPANFVDPAAHASSMLQSGRYLDALKDAPSLAANMLPQVGAVAAGSAAGGMMGGPVGAGIGGFATNAAMTAGPNVEQGGLAKGLGLTAAESAMAAGGAGPLIRRLTPGVSNPLLKTGLGMAGEAAAGGGQVAAHQAVMQGDINPYDVAVGAAAGAGAKGLIDAPGLVGAGTSALGKATASGMQNLESRRQAYQPTSEESARISQMAAQHIEAAKAAGIDAGSKPTDIQAANSARNSATNNLQSRLMELRDNGQLSDPTGAGNEYRSLMSFLAEANKHNGDLSTVQDKLDQTLSSLTDLPPDAKNSIRTSMQVINEMSGSSLQKRTQGPLESGGTVLGRAATLASGIGGFAMTGNAMHLVEGAVGGGSVGWGLGKLGRMGDYALGLDQPTVMMKAKAADRAYGEFGGQNLQEHLDSLKSFSRDPESQAFNNMPPVEPSGPPPEFTDAQKNKGMNLNEAAGAWMERQLIAKKNALDAQDAQAAKAQASSEAQAGASAAQDSVELQKQSEADARTKLKQTIAASQERARQNSQKDAGVETAYGQSAALKAAQETAAYKQNALETKGSEATSEALRKAMEQEAKVQAKNDAQAGASAAQDSVELQKQSQTAAALKASQMAVMENQRVKQNTSTDAAYTQTAALKAAQETAAYKQNALETKGSEATSVALNKAMETSANHVERQSDRLSLIEKRNAQQVDEVGNPIGPIPMNTPLSSTGKPIGITKPSMLEKAQGLSHSPNPLAAILAGADPVAPPRMSPSAPTVEPAVAPTVASPGAVPSATFGHAADTHVLPGGSSAYAGKIYDTLATQGGSLGARPGNLERAQAVQHMVDNGTISRMLNDPTRDVNQMAQAHLNGQLSGPLGKAMGQGEALQIAQNRGVLSDVGTKRTSDNPIAPVFTAAKPEGPVGSAGLDGKGNPIKNPIGYTMAATAARMATENGIKAANKQGFDRLSTVLNQMANEPTALGKTQIANSYETAMKSSRSPLAKAELAFSKTLLTRKGLIMKGTS